jgi:1-deoxy-D-xylulose-5-phosphate reductoisomerase
MKQISILGSTGSIGRQTLDVVARHPGLFRVVAMAAGTSMETLAEQVRAVRPELVSVADGARAADLKARLSSLNGARPEILIGAEGLDAVATHPSADIVISAAVGVVGLPATYAAIRQGKAVALANKEVLVAAGELVMAAARKAGVALLPVDSEHNAIHQCLRAGAPKEVRRLVLTASGGPFRTTPAAQLKHVTPEQALAHPNWRMGQRITIDSATLMNKGFEVIEARWLFGMGMDRIDVVIHPQSIVHSMVEYVDGSVLAQLGPPDMRLPIQYALTYPDRVPSEGARLDWSRIEKLEFTQPEPGKFPCLDLAREATRRGGAAPCALNAADETAVAAFLAGRIPFIGIARVVASVLEKTSSAALGSIDDVLAADREARRLAEGFVAAEGPLQKMARTRPPGAVRGKASGKARMKRRRAPGRKD